MSGFTGPIITLVGLARIDLPDHTMRLCDGGFCYFEGVRYAASDSIFGVLAGVETVEEKLGDNAPGGKLSFFPPDATSAATLMANYQNSRMRFWFGQIGDDLKTVINAELLADVQIDTTTTILSQGRRVWEVEYVSRAEKLFLRNEGNALSPRFHKSIWPGERGLDNATGLVRSVAWGTESAPRGTTSLSSGSGGGSSGDSRFQLAGPA